MPRVALKGTQGKDSSIVRVFADPKGGIKGDTRQTPPLSECFTDVKGGIKRNTRQTTVGLKTEKCSYFHLQALYGGFTNVFVTKIPFLLKS